MTSNTPKPELLEPGIYRVISRGRTRYKVRVRLEGRNGAGQKFANATKDTLKEARDFKTDALKARRDGDVKVLTDKTTFREIVDVWESIQTVRPTTLVAYRTHTQRAVAQKAPFPSGTTTASGLYGLVPSACRPDGTCAAIAEYVDKSSMWGLFTYSGGTWSAVQAPLPPDGASLVTSSGGSIACGAAACGAAYGYQTAAGDYPQALALYASGAWSASETIVPADATSPNGRFIQSITCGVGTTCFAGGEYNTQQGQSSGYTMWMH